MVPEGFAAAGSYTVNIIWQYLCTTHKGQPVGWCITDREDQDVIKLFLERIKEQSPESCTCIGHHDR